MAVAEAVQAAQVFANEVKTFVSSLALSPESKKKNGKENQESQHAKVCESLVSLAEAYAAKHETTCAKALEVSLRRTLCDILSRPPDNAASTSGAKRSKKGSKATSDTTSSVAMVDESWRQVSALLDVTLNLFREGKVAHGAFMFLLEDLAEEASLALCEKLFQYIETKQPSVLALSKNRLLLLKTCNKLLKRLSREDNPALCGRLLILVTKLLPLSERSGVNLVGAFDVENTTDFQELEEGSKDESGREVDTILYNSLWKVQKLLSNPPSILEGKNFMEFQASTIQVLLAFDKTSLKSEGQDLSNNVNNFESLKYSTSPNLLTLQLHDATFKCEYLLQVLMVLNHLKIELPTKSTLNQSKADKLARQKQLEDISKLEALVNKSLKKFIPSETFGLIRTFLQRERHWILWKKVGTKVTQQVPVAASGGKSEGEMKEVVKFNKCPPFERKSLPEDSEMFEEEAQNSGVAKAEKGPPLKKRRTAMPGFGANQVKLGNESLDRLWNLTEDNYECLDFEDQEKVPRMDDLVQRVVDQAQPDSQVDEEDKLMSDMLYCWRVKRLLAQGSCKDFLKSCQGNLEQLLPVVFPHLKDKIPVKEEEKKTEEVEMKDVEEEKGKLKKEGEEDKEDGMEEGKTAAETNQEADGSKEEAKAKEDGEVEIKETEELKAEKE